MFKKVTTSLLVFILVCYSTLLLGCGTATVHTNIKPYYSDYLSEKINTIKSIQNEHEITDSFFFITDLHWEANVGQSQYIIPAISAQTGIETVNLGGDYVAIDYDDTSKSLELMKEATSAYPLKNCYAILGNHETNKAHGYDTPMISDEEANAVINKNRFDKTYYYIENTDTHVVSLYLNSNSLELGDEQYMWIKDKLLSYNSDWTALIFTHMYCSFVPDSTHQSPYMHRHEKGIVLDNLLESIADMTQCHIAGIFSGHTHLDWFEYNDCGYPIVVTMSDSIGVYSEVSADGNQPIKRESGTTTEQAFDVVQIDTTARKVFITRFGAGNDRAYNY